MDPILQAAQRELDQVLAEEKKLNAQASELAVRRDANAKRKRVLTEFFRTAQSLSTMEVKAPTVTAVVTATPKPADKEQPYKKIIISAAESLLRETKYISTRTLVEKLESMGIEVRGDSTDRKIMRTSVVLNKDKRFKADRKLGWSLVETTPAQPRNGEGAQRLPASPQ